MVPGAMPGTKLRDRGRNRIVEDGTVTPPTATMVGAPRRGGTISVRAQSDPAATLVLLASRDPLWTSLESAMGTSGLFGSVLTHPETIAGPFRADAHGRLQIDWAVPMAFPIGQLKTLQFAAIGSSGLWTTNPVPFLIGP